MSFDSVHLESLSAPIKNAIVGGPFGSNLVGKDYTTGGIPVIRGQNMGERWVSGDFVYVSEDKARALTPKQGAARRSCIYPTGDARPGCDRPFWKIP